MSSSAAVGVEGARTTKTNAEAKRKGIIFCNVWFIVNIIINTLAYNVIMKTTRSSKLLCAFGLPIARGHSPVIYRSKCIISFPFTAEKLVVTFPNIARALSTLFWEGLTYFRIFFVNTVL